MCVAVGEAIRGRIRDSLTALWTESVGTILLHRADDLFVADTATAAVLDAEVFAWQHVSLGRLGQHSSRTDGRLCRPERVVCATPVQSAGSSPIDRARSAGTGCSVAGRSWYRRRRTLHGLVDELERVDLVDLAINYPLGHEFIDSLVLGARRGEQLSTVQQYFTRPPLAQQEVELVQARINAAPLDLIDRPGGPGSSHQTLISRAVPGPSRSASAALRPETASSSDNALLATSGPMSSP